ncbi:probable pectin methylesterase CGR2 [Fagus crenata]
MSRRPVNPSRRIVDGASIPFMATVQSKSRSSPLISIGLVIVGAILLIGYSYSGSGGSSSDIEAVRKLRKFEGSVSCTSEVQRALPILKKAYGHSMQKVLHVGPDTCPVVSKLLKEEDTEAWGVEPYEIDDTDATCKSLVHKGIVRVADIKFPLPYGPKSFSVVIVSDTLDYLSPKYLNRTLPELIRVSSDGVVIFAGYPGQQRAKGAELSKFGRPAKLRSSSWWIRYFVQNRLEENEAASKKFEQASAKRSYKSACQVFHLKSHH